MRLSKQAEYQKKFMIDIKNYHVIQPIESGAFGSVCLVRNQNDEKEYAGKVINLGKDESKSKLMIDREIGILMRFQHPTIITFYGFSLYDFNGNKNVTLIMQFAKNGSLAKLLEKSQKSLLDSIYDNTMRQIILVGIARGMMYLHQHRVIHRDLKPDNILLDEDFRPLITDFGLSKLYDIGHSKSQSQQCGTTVYMAPEVITSQQYNGKADVYSFGILMYEVVTDSFAYPELNTGKVTVFDFNNKVVNENYRPKLDASIKPSIQELIERCWSQDPKERPTFEEIFKKLAFNEEENIYDIDSQEEKNKYYLDDVDVDALQFYIDEIYDDSSVEKVTKTSIQTEELQKKLEILSKENEEMKIKNEQTLQKIESLKNEIAPLSKENEQMKVQINNFKNYFQQTQLKQEDALKRMETFEKRLLLRERITMDVFNSLSLKSQQLVASKIASNSASSKICHEYSKLNKLLLYLIHVNSNSDDFCFVEITTTNGEELQSCPKLSQVLLLSEATELLYRNKLLDSTDFISIIKHIDNFCIELKNPSKNYKKMYDMISNMNSSESSCCAKISLFISGITDIDLSFQKDTNIGSIIVDFSVSSIADSAFSGCSSLIYISLPSTIQSIGRGLFKECSSLKQITVPSSVCSIGDFAFTGCSSLYLLFLPSTIQSIGSYAFSECISLKKVTIPSSLCVIKEGAFRGCSSLSQVEIPNSVTDIGEGSFSGCSSIKELVIPNSVKSIGDNAFSVCLSLVKVTLPASVSSVGSCAFYGCSALKEVSILSSDVSVGEKAFFGCDLLKDVKLPSSLKSFVKEIFPSKTTISYT